MRRINTIFTVARAIPLMVALVVFGLAPAAHADAANAPSLIISQLKITSSSGQFVTLYNTTDAVLDLSNYQLEYFNSFDLTKATTSRLIALSGTVPPHGYFMVNDDSLLLCYRLAVDSVSLGFSSTAGMVEVLGFNQEGPGESVVPMLQDYAAWSKSTAPGVRTLPAGTDSFLMRQPLDQTNNPQVGGPGAGSWQAVQPDPHNPCALVTTLAAAPVPTGMNVLLPPSEPPSTVVAADSTGVATPSVGLPAADIGLHSPQITELLPNPAGTGTDATDEFIELYNANAAAFDLSGFSLQVGSTTTHAYTFPTGTSIPAHSFTAFFSEDTKLSLSNTAGQAKLLDPFGNSLSASAVYEKAKDGVSWSLAKGKWYWTTTVTPGKANVIKEPPSSKKAAAASKATSKKGSTKVKTTSTKKLSGTAASMSPDENPTTPIHPATLAAIGGVAVVYGLYEYRADVANRFYQLRRHASAWRSGRSPAEGGRGD